MFGPCCLPQEEKELFSLLWCRGSIRLISSSAELREILLHLRGMLTGTILLPAHGMEQVRLTAHKYCAKISHIPNHWLWFQPPVPTICMLIATSQMMIFLTTYSLPKSAWDQIVWLLFLPLKVPTVTKMLLSRIRWLFCWQCTRQNRIQLTLRLVCQFCKAIRNKNKFLPVKWAGQMEGHIDI